MMIESSGLLVLDACRCSEIGDRRDSGQDIVDSDII